MTILRSSGAAESHKTGLTLDFTAFLNERTPALNNTNEHSGVAASTKVMTPAQRRLQNKRPDDLVVQRVEGGSDAIKDEDMINSILFYILNKHTFQSYRLFTLLITGFNFGLRISDLVKLRVKDLCTKNEEDGSYQMRDLVIIQEDKTEKPRAMYMNDATRTALSAFISSEIARRPCGLDYNEYLFVSDSPNRRYIENTAADATKQFVQCPIYEDMVRKEMRALLAELEIKNIRFTPHSLRKTFGYFICTRRGEDYGMSSRPVAFLQKLLNHTDQRVTVRYIGIDADEVRSAYQSLNIGLDIVKKFL